MKIRMLAFLDMLYILLFHSFLFIGSVNADDEYQIWAKRILDRLMQKHNVNIAPKPLFGALQVDVTFRMTKLVALNSIDQTLTVVSDLNMVGFCFINMRNKKFTFFLEWNDTTLVWDPANYSGIDNLVLPRKLIWQPDIFAFNMRDYKDLVPSERATMRVESSGLVNLDLTMVFTQVCTLAVDLFPFDNQTCDIALASATMNSKELKINPYFNDNGYDYSEASNGEWDITKVEALSASDTNRNMTYDLVALGISMNRKPAYYINVIIIPTFLLVAVCILGIFGPKPESDIGPEKIPLALATLVPMTVLLSIIAGTLPRSGISLLGYFVIFEIAVCSGAAFVLVIVSFARTIKKQIGIVGKKYRKRKDEQIRNKTITVTLQSITEKKFNNNDMVKARSDASFTDAAKFDERLEAFLASSFELRDEIDQFLIDHWKRTAQRVLKEKTAASWSQTAAFINMILCFIFEGLNLALLIFMLKARQ